LFVARQELVDFIKKRQDNKAKTDAVVSEAVATLRYRKMREVVLKSDEDVRAVARELQLNLINLDVDKGFKAESDALRDANIAVLTADTNNPVAYRAAIVDLQTQHESFMKFYEKTAVYQVGLIGQVHGTLASALASPGSAEDILSYLESLKQLIETVEG